MILTDINLFLGGMTVWGTKKMQKKLAGVTDCMMTGRLSRDRTHPRDFTNSPAPYQLSWRYWNCQIFVYFKSFSCALNILYSRLCLIQCTQRQKWTNMYVYFMWIIDNCSFYIFSSQPQLFFSKVMVLSPSRLSWHRAGPGCSITMMEAFCAAAKLWKGTYQTAAGAAGAAGIT